MTDVEAAIGRKQLERLDEMLDRRRANGAILQEGLADIDGMACQKTTDKGTHAYHQFCLTIDPDVTGKTRDDLGNYLKDQGIGSGIHYPRGLHQQPVFVEMYGESHHPVTERLAEQILAVPVHHGMGDEEARRVVDAIRSFAARA